MSENKRIDPLSISVEQSKLLGNALRIKIIRALYDQPMTSKQVATHIGESPGNVHYHIQKLNQGGLIELVDEKRVGGVVEKYYRAKAKLFTSELDNNQLFQELQDGFSSETSTNIGLRLQLTEQDYEDLVSEFQAFIDRWVKRTSTSDRAQAQEYGIGIKIVSTKEKKQEKQEK